MSKLGFLFSGIFIALAILLITTQGIFGESFVAIILGLPWSLLPAFFEFGNLSGPVIYALVIAPIILNTVLLYALGYGISTIYHRYIPRNTEYGL